MGASRILVVDDDPASRELIRVALTLEGLEIVTVEGGVAALEHLRREPVDVVLLDRMMPGMDGIKVLQAIRADPDLTLVPVILVTALHDPAATIEGLDHGANDYVTKPFDLPELAARVRSQLRGTRAWIDRLTADVSRRRAALAAGTEAAGAASSMPAATTALCRALVSEPDVAGVEILEVAGLGVERIGGAGVDGLAALRIAGASEALRGIEHGLPAGPCRVSLPDLVISLAPVRDRAGTLAVVAITGPPGAPASVVDGLLALTIDAAAVTAGVLTEPLRTSRHRAEAHARIRDLVLDGAFRPVFQPIVDLGTGEVIGHEALTRFAAGLDPAEVFGTATRLGVGHDLERATLAAAVERARRQPPGCWLALNVTPSLLLDPPPLDEILRAAGRHDIVLEISEMEPVHDYGVLLASIADLQAAVQISVDDAGAGFASLAHILALGARYVKLDKSWIHGIDLDPAKRALVAGLQSFAGETGTSLIAEGIETEDQLAEVRWLGIAYGQGWLLGKPGDL